MVLPSLSRRALKALLAVACVVPLAAACGGRSDTEEYLFGADGPITVGASSSIGGSATAGRTGVGGSAPVTGGTAAGVGATTAIGGTGIGTAGEPSVGGTGVAGSGQGGIGVAGAAGAPSGPPITCGGEVCDSATQTCCAGGFGAFQCIAQGAVCQGAVLACTNNADCGMELCCLSLTGDADAASSCKPRCNTMGGGRDRQLCQVDDDCRDPFRFCTPTVFGVNICTRRP